MSIHKLLMTLAFLSGSIVASHAQDLQSLVNEALENSPQLKALNLQNKALNERQQEVMSYPETNISVGYFITEPETKTGPQKFKLSFKQMIPWFGTIASRQKLMATMADTQYQDLLIARRNLIAEVTNTYYQLYEITQKEKIFDENIKLLKTYEDFALTAVEANKASAVELLKLQMRKNDLEELRKVLDEKQESLENKLNKLLNRKENQSVQVADHLFIPQQDSITDTQKLLLHPELTKFDKLYQSVRQSELVNRKEALPQIGFGLDYINVAKLPDMNIAHNGRDIFMPMVSLSVPLFQKKNRSVTRQNRWKMQQIEEQKDNRLNELKTLLQTAVNNLAAARITYSLQTKNLQQAEAAEQILYKSYESGTIDFDDVLDIQELQLKFQIKQLSALTSYYLQQTAINYLTQF